MSVTFYAELTEPVGYVVACACEQAVDRARMFESYEAAKTARFRANREERRALPGCEMPDVCIDYDLTVTARFEERDPSVNMSGVNARGVLEALGYADRITDSKVFGVLFASSAGSASAEDFKGRVLTALVLAPEDSGTPTTETGNVTSVGRSPGYLQHTLRNLEELADWCAARGRKVCWA